MSKKEDKIKNWTKIAQKKKVGGSIEPDKNYPKHEIKPCKMIACIGPTGSGKSNALLEFLSRKNDAFHEIILFTGSTTDEDLYNFLNDALDGEVNMIEDIDELPELCDYNEEDKGLERLLIMDDIINLKKSELVKLQKWFNSARKYGFTCIAMCQNWSDMPIQMRRNSHYIWLFKLKDMNQVNQIMKTANHEGLDLDLLRQLYSDATSEVGQFLKIDMTGEGIRDKYRTNFIGRFF